MKAQIITTNPKVMTWDKNNLTKDELAFIDGEYTIHFDGDEMKAYIDVENEEFSIGDWHVDGEEAINAITEVYLFYNHSKDTVESAIEQYAYDLTR